MVCFGEWFHYPNQLTLEINIFALSDLSVGCVQGSKNHFEVGEWGKFYICLF
uniref:Uncharacterized protein n=1 Tax=Anguilla anguilla TaxID=7936 RepID=A0A0E9WHT4_ANGAN